MPRTPRRPATPSASSTGTAVAALTAALAATALAAVAPADAAPGGSVAATRATATSCQGTAFLYGIRADGTLTFAAVNAATNGQTRKFVGSKLPFTPRTMATLNHDTILATSTTGGLYRIDVTDNTTVLTATTTRLATSGWAHDKLTADGFGHLFGTIGTNNMLMRYDVAGTKPTAAGITKPTRIGAIYTLTSMTATGGGQLVGTTESGKLLGYKAIGEGRFEARTLLASGFTGVDKVTAAGSGVFYGRTAAGGALTTRRDANVGDQSGTDITTVGTVSPSGWTQKLLSAAPKTVTCGGGSTSITYADLVAMFGAGWVGDKTVVEAGLPTLEAEMRKGSITTPARQAAFLATLVSESAVRFDADQGGSYSYRGRGYIQLTNDFNYEAAGTYLGIDLLAQPDLARAMKWSAPIARWYWTVARTTTNTYADDHDMSGVNRNIGFAWSYEEATRRCDRFKSAFTVLSGNAPAHTICYPASMPPAGSTSWNLMDNPTQD